MVREQLSSTEELALNRLIGRDFIRHRLQNLQKLYPDYYEYSSSSTQSEDEDEYDEGIIWNWVYEAESDYIAKKITENEDKITKKAGVAVVILPKDDLDEYDTGVFIGFTGAGYDFLSAHWYPLFKIIYPDLDDWLIEMA